MPDIEVKFKNHCYVEVNGEKSILRELYERFTYDVPDAKYMPKFKLGVWDGKARLFNYSQKLIHFGLIPEVKKFCENNNYSYSDDIQYNKNEFPTKEFITKLKLPSKIEIRDYQIEAVNLFIRDNRILLLSPTSSGKSLIIYCCIRYHLLNKRKILIIVPTVGLRTQLKADFIDYSSENNWDAENNIHLIEDKKKVTDRRITICTWQSIQNMPVDFFKDFDVVIGDEAHKFQATKISGILDKMPHCQYRLGTTGTIKNSELDSLKLQGVFGNIHQVTTTKELMDRGQVTKLDIKCLILEHNLKLKKSPDYPDEMSYLITNQKRNKFIERLAIDQKSNTLLLFQYVDHGELLYNNIINNVLGDREVFLIHGSTDKDIREEIRLKISTLNNVILLASYGTFSTGINAPNIHSIIFCSPSKSKIRNLQSIGRGLRLLEGKKICTLYDIADKLQAKKSSENITLKHLHERIELYAAEQFNYKLIKVQL